MEKYAELKEIIERLKITVLVNNAGICSAYPDFYNNQSEKEISDIIQVNINGVLETTKVILPKLLENKKGVMLNLGSYVGELPPPLLATYAGTKSFINTWSSSLNGELKGKGIQVLSFTPMYVQSNMSGFKKSSLSVPSPNSFAESCLKWVGNPFVGAIVSPYLIHNITTFLFSLVPYKIRQNKELSTLKKIGERMKSKLEVK